MFDNFFLDIWVVCVLCDTQTYIGAHSTGYELLGMFNPPCWSPGAYAMRERW